MAYRNGIVADTLRKAGQPYGVIFGLQLPQLSEIARDSSSSVDIARNLWAERNVRESRLLATYLFPIESLDIKEAISMGSDVITREEADVLAFRLLRRHPNAVNIAEKLLESDNPLVHYAGEALMRNLQ